jgi:hypothetical protein
MKTKFKNLLEPQRYRYFDLLDALRPDGGVLCLVRYYGNQAPVVAARLRALWGDSPPPAYADQGERLMATPWVAAFVLKGSTYVE